MELTPENVEKVFGECLAKAEGENNGIKVEGVVHNFVFFKK